MEALGDSEIQKIISLTHKHGKTSSEISHEAGIPLSSVYRKISQLRQANLLTIETFRMTPEGKKEEVLRSTYDKLEVAVTETGLEITVVPNRDLDVSKWIRLFTESTQ
ncbi:MAG: winged helix-turn-helix transcriptional regulator [Thaumarchaeota archaeon]|nr:winged helix-turn-helix transcriptional regulator [Nitrososphaerota archaeon]